ncbi:hypothetical protein IQ07DRAFT_71804 [Pyrenochaeta sp. DS3sAY3a]|nr:hypothetical protein IQ07DRAFT_71804 [Pyrenochaeta sp. DS3sAY3a]
MQATRLRPFTLTIPIPPNTQGLTRPPTPRRATFPMISPAYTTDPNAPPIPPLSYWEPDTPSPMSTNNPFLSPPPVHLQSLFPVASPLLPSSPLSIFDSAISPTSNTFLGMRIPTPAGTTFLLPATPSVQLTPRFLFPRTPPCPPKIHRRATLDAVQEILTRRVSIVSVVAARETTVSQSRRILLAGKWQGVKNRAMTKAQGCLNRETAQMWWNRLLATRKRPARRTGDA